MRRIRKTSPPPLLRAWIAATKNSPNFNYYALPGRVKTQLKSRLLREQGHLCAYTGLEITDADAHIEHLRPQTACNPGDDVDYLNVVACYPANGGDTSFGYGAPIKDEWWDDALFVSPLSASCEQRFAFSWSGKIKPKPTGNAAAQETITRLGLASQGLVLLRRKAINGFFGFGEGKRPITKQKARALLTAINRAKPPSSLVAFCFVFAQLLPKYAPPRK